MSPTIVLALVAAGGILMAFLGLTGGPAVQLKAPGQVGGMTGALAQLQARMDAAELPATARDFVIYCGAAIALSALVAIAFGTPALALAGVLIAPLVIWQVFEGRRDNFRQIYDESLAEIAQLLREGFSATSTLRGALDHAARNGPDPAAADFREVWSGTQLGRDTSEAFAPVVERRRNPHLRMVAEALSLKATEGGNVGEVLIGLETMVRDQVSLRREIAAKQSQARLESYVVCLAPLGFFVLMQVLPWMRAYQGAFYHEALGQLILGAAMVASAIAFFLARYLATRGLTLEVKEA